MPARRPLFGIAAALTLAWACTDDPASPGGSLTEEEVLELSTRMSELILSGLADLEMPDSRILGSGADISCDGGTVNLRFSNPEIGDSGRSVSFDYEAKPDGCVLSGEDVVIWGDPSISGAFALTFLNGIEEMTGQIIFRGSFRYTAVEDGRTGTCDIDLVESAMTTIESTEATEQAVTWKGTVCGIGIDHREERSYPLPSTRIVRMSMS